MNEINNMNYFDGLMQERRNSIAIALELRLSCTNPLTRFNTIHYSISIPYIFAITHYNDVIMGTIASQITSLTIVYSTVYSDADQRKHESSTSLAFVRGIHRSPVNWPVAENVFIWWRHHVLVITIVAVTVVHKWLTRGPFNPYFTVQY